MERETSSLYKLLLTVFDHVYCRLSWLAIYQPTPGWYVGRVLTDTLLIHGQYNYISANSWLSVACLVVKYGSICWLLFSCHLSDTPLTICRPILNKTYWKSTFTQPTLYWWSADILADGILPVSVDEYSAEAFTKCWSIYQLLVLADTAYGKHVSMTLNYCDFNGLCM